MMDDCFVDIRAISDLEECIRNFGHQMACTNDEIEHNIELYFQNFECGQQILDDRLQMAEKELERAIIALERQRNKRVLVRDSDGDGWHWEQADCSAEEAKVTRCKDVRDKCLRDVDICRQIISEARTRRYIHKDKFSQLEKGVTEAVDKIGPIKELIERHRMISVPSSSISSSRDSSSTVSTTSSAYSASIRGANMSRPRSPMNSSQSFGPKPSPLTERPRAPMNERVKPAPNRPLTDADRPRSPFGGAGSMNRNNTSSFWDDIRNINEEHQKEESDE